MLQKYNLSTLITDKGIITESCSTQVLTIIFILT